ncbi:translation initiation factor 2 [Streptomyces sp. SBT349]|uniref:translation initiation factor 2 n=1 Tax=Streptomyces sp. SBT349 TaxID=1580539 RepID=UPI002D21CD3F|nr:translation initiation factor 2 [Streptomyces sp. SBT349]
MRVRYQPERVAFPEEIGAWRREIDEGQKRAEAAGERYYWNNPRFAVEHLVISRTHNEEEPRAILALCDADYYDFLATSINLDRNQANGISLRQEYLEDRDPVEAPAFMRCSFGVNVALETGADHMMVMSHRSKHVAGPNALKWNSSANEGLARHHDLPADGSPISLHAVAYRALREELAVRRDDIGELELLGFALDLVNNQLGCFFRAIAPRLTEPELRDRWSKGVEDKWEHDGHAFVDAAPESVLEFMLGQPEERWTPLAPAQFYLTLVRDAVIEHGDESSGRWAVEAAERRVMRRLGLA